CGRLLDVADVTYADAGAPEAGIVIDAALPDADSGPREGGTLPCGAIHTFCDDFDEGVLEAPWVKATTGDASAMGVPFVGVGSSYALQAVAPGGFDAIVTWPHIRSAVGITCAFDMRIVEGTATTASYVVQLSSVALNHPPVYTAAVEAVGLNFRLELYTP